MPRAKPEAADGEAASDPRLRLVALLCAAALALLATASFVWFFGWGTSTPDVTAYWRAGQNLLAGEPIHGAPPPGASPKAFLYPPAFAVLFAPFTLLPPVTGYAAWMALHFVFLAVLVVACAQLAGLGSRRAWCCYLALLLVWLPAPVGADFQEGQVNLLVACVMVLGLLRVERGRWRSGALLLALAVHIKLLPVVLFAVLLVQGRVRAVAAGAVAILVLVLLPAVVTVPREGLAEGLAHVVTMHLDYAHVVLAPAAADARVVGDEQFYVLNNSLVAVLHRLFGDGVAFSPFPELAGWRGPLLFALPRTLLRVASAAAGLALLAASLVLARRARDSRAGRMAACAAAFAAVEVATLNCWEHHVVFVALLLAPLAVRAEAGRALTILGGFVLALWTGPYLLHPLASLLGADVIGRLLTGARAWGFPTLAVLVLMLLVMAAHGRRSELVPDAAAP